MSQSDAQNYQNYLRPFCLLFERFAKSVKALSERAQESGSEKFLREYRKLRVGQAYKKHSLFYNQDVLEGRDCHLLFISGFGVRTERLKSIHVYFSRSQCSVRSKLITVFPSDISPEWTISIAFSNGKRKGSTNSSSSTLISVSSISVAA